MGMPAARGIALGRDQHVLAERRQVAATQRAGVRRRLAVLGAAQIPPARPWKAGVRHLASIASPLAEAVSSPPVEQNLKRIVAETERYRISGMLRLPPDGYRSRLSDYLNAPDREFLALTDVEVEAVGGDGTVERYPFVALSLRHIVVAMPADQTSE
jgi:hypothetical protein